MSYGINPFSARDATATRDVGQTTFGALPYPGSDSANPPLHTLVSFRFTSFNQTILDSKVVGPNGETCFRVTTDGQGHTLLKDAAGHHIGLVGWETHPTVETQSIGGKKYVTQWLQLSADKSARVMTHGGVHYAWAPHNQYLHLFAAGAAEWLARVTRSTGAVLLELTPRAVELGLMHSVVLATLLLQCGKNID